MKNTALAFKMKKYKKSEIIEAFSKLFEADEIFEKALCYLDDKKQNEAFERERIAIECCAEKIDAYAAWQKEIAVKYGAFCLDSLPKDELARGIVLGEQMELAIKQRDEAIQVTEKMFRKGEPHEQQRRTIRKTDKRTMD